MLKVVRCRVITQEKGLCRISDGSEEKWAEVSGKFRFQAETPSDYPVVGDYVLALWPEEDSRAVIEMLFPRRTAFVRRAAGADSHEQVVAANIDTIFLCMSLNNDYNLRRLERYLATAWDSGAEPVVVLTKADLCDDLTEKLLEIQGVAAGVNVVTVSSLRGEIDGVMDYLTAGRTVAFLGSSGVGKSTLINRLLGREQLATNGLRNDDKGRHTTTHRELIELPCGAAVIDTPGMRELGMWEHESGIEAAFSDVEAVLGRCRFSDCTHSGEPGCGVRRALETGELDGERWAAYLKLKAENDFCADEQGYLRAKRSKFKEIAKINKSRGRKKR